MINDLTRDQPGRAPRPAGFIDGFGRSVRYLRVSVTDACNLRCVYCMPEDAVFRPPAEILQDDEIVRLVRLFTGLGFRKYRLTGGEPTLRENIVEIVRRLSSLPRAEEVTLTTNATKLASLAGPLAAAGLRRVNVRLDTLDPKKFQLMSRRGHFEDVWAGLMAAEKAGLAIKLNAVVVRGFNEGEDAVELARLTRTRPWQVRFIEVMPFGALAGFQRGSIVSEAELHCTIAAALGPILPVPGTPTDGPARLYRLEDARGTLGFISSVTRPFCSTCDRVRLTADGHLRLCLLNEDETDLLGPLRAGATDDELTGLIRTTLDRKPCEHGLAEQVAPLDRIMSEIGG